MTMKISVCIATYNGEKYIKEQLLSILPQLSANDEVVISDDSSTDNTLKIIDQIQDERIKVFKNIQNVGYSKNFENSLRKAQGDIIFICDQDDVWMSNKVNKMTDALKNADVVVSDAEIVDDELNSVFPSHFIKHNTKQGLVINFLKTRYIGACMAFKREVLEKALPFPKNNYLCVYDYWLTLIAESFFDVKLVNEPLMKYRRHDSNASNGGQKSTNSLYKKLSTRVYVLKELLKRKFRS